MDERQRKELEKLGGTNIHFACPMDCYTTFRVGGKADALYLSPDLPSLKEIIAWLNREGIPYMTIGKGSNLLVRDEGFKGVMIILNEKLSAIEKNGENDRVIFAGGGLSINRLMEYCRIYGLSGLEFLAGIPGTVGGAIAMNAGAFGKDIGSMVQEIHVIMNNGELIIQDRSDLRFAYRGILNLKGSVIVKARFELDRERQELISERVTHYLKKRKETQPLEYPSGGSVFKNPPNDYAARLIEMVGLKGKKKGGAMISEKHANFIVNTGGAKAEDILSLINLAQKTVLEGTGIELEPEIRIVGN